MREHCFNLTSVKLSPEILKEYDAVLLATNHDGFDYQLIEEHSNLRIDTRGVYSANNDKIVKTYSIKFYVFVETQYKLI